MTTAFISFPAAAGGNHLRNIIVNSSDFLNDYQYKESIDNQYRADGIMNVHGADIGSSSIDGNINSFKLHRSLLNPSSNSLLYGHFAELMSLRNDIKQIRDKKIIILSIDTDRCKQIIYSRSKDIGLQRAEGEYFIGEQVFLYESFMYCSLFNTKQSDVMNIGIHEWFKTDISDIIDRLSFFLGVKFDYNKCQEMHSIWAKKNSKFF